MATTRMLNFSSVLFDYSLDESTRASLSVSNFRLIPGIASVTLLIILSVTIWLYQRQSKSLKSSSITAAKHKATARPAGVWIPQVFSRPSVTPYPGWDIQTTKPLPYRPFRFGPYYITLGIRRMKWDEWIELDNQYPIYHQRKIERIAERGPLLSKTAPEAREGAYELLEELCDYLPQRYPSLFRKTTRGMDNLHTGESFDIKERPLIEDPMQMAARMVQDDLVIMFEKSDGQYYFLAGSVMLPGSWRLKDKFGMPLSEIHTSGDVPGYKAKLEKGMMNLFRRIQPDQPVLRNNYFFQLDDDLAWNHSLGPENFDEVKNNTDKKIHTLKDHWSTVEKDKPIERHWFRSERQSLRRLPRTGGVVFTFRTYFHRIVDIAEEPGVPGRLASAVRSWGPDVAKYKGREKYQDVLLKYLDSKHEEQKKLGLINEEQELEKNSYPY